MTLTEASRVLEEKYPRGFDVTFFHSVCKKLKRVVILRTSWYPEIVDGLVASAKAYLKENHVPDAAVEVMHVPGSFELPLAAQEYLNLNPEHRPEIILALGCVLRGDTPHFDFVCHGVTQGLMAVTLEHHTPVGFGVLTVDTVAQAHSRGAKGAEAAQAALAMLLLRRHLEHHHGYSEGHLSHKKTVGAQSPALKR